MRIELTVPEAGGRAKSDPNVRIGMAEPFLPRRRASLFRVSLANQTLLLIDRKMSPGVYDRTLALFRERGVEPKTVSTAALSGDEAGSILVDSGKGIYIAVGKNPIHPAFTDRLITLPLNDSAAVTDVHVVWRRDEQSRTTVDFVRFTRNGFQEKKLSKHDDELDMQSGGLMSSRVTSQSKRYRPKR